MARSTTGGLIWHSRTIRSKRSGALRQVYDPELGLDIVSMGLIYRLEAEGDRVKIDMTLTTPGCPVSETLPEMARLAAANAGARRRKPNRLPDRVGSAMVPRPDRTGKPGIGPVMDLAWPYPNEVTPRRFR
ncbi:MAG: metal-sulfur cluster assembly factor [Candidatus Microthrix sp.]|nr:metal-sulfur cluster assembly factor [Candidatus Microthrix sp.]MBK7321399.1 metal-sulfur cluster assembly factor [Candidatus Microthrix sp.]